MESSFAEVRSQETILTFPPATAQYKETDHVVPRQIPNNLANQHLPPLLNSNHHLAPPDNHSFGQAALQYPTSHRMFIAGGSMISQMTDDSNSFALENIYKTADVMPSARMNYGHEAASSYYQPHYNNVILNNNNNINNSRMMLQQNHQQQNTQMKLKSQNFGPLPLLYNNAYPFMGPHHHNGSPLLVENKSFPAPAHQQTPPLNFQAGLAPTLNHLLQTPSPSTNHYGVLKESSEFSVNLHSQKIQTHFNSERNLPNHNIVLSISQTVPFFPRNLPFYGSSTLQTPHGSNYLRQQQHHSELSHFQSRMTRDYSSNNIYNPTYQQSQFPFNNHCSPYPNLMPSYSDTNSNQLIPAPLQQHQRVSNKDTFFPDLLKLNDGSSSIHSNNSRLSSDGTESKNLDTLPGFPTTTGNLSNPLSETDMGGGRKGRYIKRDGTLSKYPRKKKKSLPTVDILSSESTSAETTCVVASSICNMTTSTAPTGNSVSIVRVMDQTTHKNIDESIDCILAKTQSQATITHPSSFCELSNDLQNPIIANINPIDLTPTNSSSHLLSTAPCSINVANSTYSSYASHLNCYSSIPVSSSSNKDLVSSPSTRKIDDRNLETLVLTEAILVSKTTSTLEPNCPLSLTLVDNQDKQLYKEPNNFVNLPNLDDKCDIKFSGYLNEENPSNTHNIDSLNKIKTQVFASDNFNFSLDEKESCFKTTFTKPIHTFGGTDVEGFKKSLNHYNNNPPYHNLNYTAVASPFIGHFSSQLHHNANSYSPHVLSPGAGSIQSYSTTTDDKIPSTPSSSIIIPPTGSQIIARKNEPISKLYDFGSEPERRIFLDHLLQFNEQNANVLAFIPTVSKAYVDLFKLYHMVKEKGGVLQVNQKKLWKDIAVHVLEGQSNPISASYNLRKQYVKCLLDYECKFDMNGADPAPIIAQLEASSKKKKKKPVASNELDQSVISNGNNSESQSTTTFSMGGLRTPGTPQSQQPQPSNNFPIRGFGSGGSSQNAFFYDSQHSQNQIRPENIPPPYYHNNQNSSSCFSSLPTSLAPQPPVPSAVRGSHPQAYHNYSGGSPYPSYHHPAASPYTFTNQQPPPFHRGGLPPPSYPNPPNTPLLRPSFMVATPGGGSSTHPNHLIPPVDYNPYRGMSPLQPPPHPTGHKNLPPYPLLSSSRMRPPFHHHPLNEEMSFARNPFSEVEAGAASNFPQQYQQNLAPRFNLLPSSSLPTSSIQQQPFLRPTIYPAFCQPLPQPHHHDSSFMNPTYSFSNRNPGTIHLQSDTLKPAVAGPSFIHEPILSNNNNNSMNMSHFPNHIPPHGSQTFYDGRPPQERLYVGGIEQSKNVETQNLNMPPVILPPHNPLNTTNLTHRTYDNLHLPVRGLQQPSFSGTPTYPSLISTNKELANARTPDPFVDRQLFPQKPPSRSNILGINPPPNILITDNNYIDPKLLKYSSNSSFNFQRAAGTPSNLNNPVGHLPPYRQGEKPLYPATGFRGSQIQLNCVEGTVPKFIKFRRLHPPRDISLADINKLVIILKSGIFHLSMAALDSLNILIGDDSKNTFFNLGNGLPSDFLDLILDYYEAGFDYIFKKKSLVEVDDSLVASCRNKFFAHKNNNINVRHKSELIIKSPPRFSDEEETEVQKDDKSCTKNLKRTRHSMAKLTTSTINTRRNIFKNNHVKNYTWVSRRKKRVKIVQVNETESPISPDFASFNECCLRDDKTTQLSTGNLSCLIWYNSMHLDADIVKFRTTGDSNNIINNNDKDSKDVVSLTLNDANTKLSGRSDIVDRDIEKSGSTTNLVALDGSVATNLFPLIIQESFDHVLVTFKIMFVVSNIIRSLTFIPGNETYLIKNERYLRIMVRVLLMMKLLHNEEEGNTFSHHTAVVDTFNMLERDCWLALSRDALVQLSNLANKLDVSALPDDLITELYHKLFTTLLNKKDVKIPLAQSVAQSISAASVIASTSSYLYYPRRFLILEILSKLSVSENNVDYMIGVTDLGVLENLFALLIDFLTLNTVGHSEIMVLKELSLVLLTNLTSGGCLDIEHSSNSHGSSHATNIFPLSPRSNANNEVGKLLVDILSHHDRCFPALLQFMEEIEGNASRIIHTQGFPALRDNSELMGTSLAMLRRCANLLLTLSAKTSDPTILDKHQSRLLSLVISQILDQNVANILSQVLYLMAHPASRSSV